MHPTFKLVKILQNLFFVFKTLQIFSKMSALPHGQIS